MTNYIQTDIISTATFNFSCKMAECSMQYAWWRCIAFTAHKFLIYFQLDSLSLFFLLLLFISNFNLLRVVVFVWIHVSTTWYTIFLDDKFSSSILLNCDDCIAQATNPIDILSKILCMCAFFFLSTKNRFRFSSVFN